jgi:predicted dithiol-disulfide oxidoreductase (DUF899 family)
MGCTYAAFKEMSKNNWSFVLVGDAPLEKAQLFGQITGIAMRWISRTIDNASLNCVLAKA